MNWLTEIDRLTLLFSSEFSGLNEDELNWKPDANSWSIAQHLDHLIVINQTYFPIFAALKSGEYTPPFWGKLGFLVNFFGAAVLNAVKPEQKKKVKTFTIWEPSASSLSGDILEQFSAHQTALKNQIVASESLLQQGVIISSPANRIIVYRLETAFDIIVAHEQRHLEHAIGVLNRLQQGATTPTKNTSL